MSDAAAVDALDPGARAVLTRLVAGQRRVLGEHLVGVYLFGSAATGWFEPGISDVDTVVVLRADPTDDELVDLGRLHADIVSEFPAWDGRVEAVYLSRRALASSLHGSEPAARISPGEPFHPITVDPGWVLDWYALRAQGVALDGPPVEEVAPTVSEQTYVSAVRQHLLDSRWLESRGRDGERCYAVLTMCRGLRTCTSGEHVSKRDGATWASAIMPEHADVIAGALAWRAQRPDAKDDGLVPADATRRLIVDVQRRIGEVA